MPVYLQVRQVRDAIYQHVQHTLPTEGSTAHSSNRAFGTVFHDAVASLFSADPGRHCRAALTLAESSVESWTSTLRDILYNTAVGPYLTRNQAGLQNSASEVLGLWQAAENVSLWLGRILWRAHLEFGWPASDLPVIAAEDELSWTLREPGWSDSVTLGGIADLVLRVPRGRGEHAREDWCVVEYKLGRTSPEADLAQACLYHEMLLQGSRQSSGGTLALVSFTPGVQEQLFESSQLASAREKLKALIGYLAGVNVPATSAAISDVSDTPAATKPPPELIAIERLLLKTFRDFGAPAERAGEPVAGPAFFRFYFVPIRGIKARKMTSLADDIQVSLKLRASPIVSLVQGRITVDVERPDRQVVPFSSIRSQLAVDAASGSSMIPVGVDFSRRLIVADLADSKHVHILVVGATGSGKSEWLRTAIAGLILGNTPETLQFVLIDPKRNAFVDLAGSPFLREPIVYPQDQPASEVLARLVDEMEDRYRELQAYFADDIRGLRAHGVYLPRIVCICDEYADLIKASKPERVAIEHQIFRLGSKARAAGIHLIIATQEASRETIRGSLDANLPARVGLRTSKDIESRMLLGQNGTESLLGYGDLLFKDIGAPVRLQAPFLNAQERAAIFNSPGLSGRPATSARS